ncbi:MAG: peroxiredoxin [Myxococcota bacterium]
MTRTYVGYVLLWCALGCGGAETRPDLHQQAPDFRALDQAGQPRTLTEFRGKAVVLYFYPRDGTPGCTTEACAFRDSWDRIEALNGQVVGVSTDNVASHRQFAEEHDLDFPLLADPEGEILAAYGVGQMLGMARRITFIIDEDGVVRRVFEDVDPGVHVDEVAAVLEELQRSR